MLDHTADIHDLARAALDRPADFGYSGDLPLFDTWALCGPSQNRDSEPLDESNFAVIVADLRSRFPDDVEIVSSSHWAVGWADHLAVRVIADESRRFGDYQAPMPPLTDAFRAVVEWSAALANYPVADDADYNEREYADLVETIDGCYSPGYIERGDLEYVPRDSETVAEELARVAFNDFDAARADDLPGEDELHNAGIAAGVYVIDLKSVTAALDAARAETATAVRYAERIAQAAADNDREVMRDLLRDMADALDSETTLAWTL